MTIADPPPHPSFTSEGSQEIRPRSQIPVAELLREVGSVLRLSEAEAAARCAR